MTERYAHLATEHRASDAHLLASPHCPLKVGPGPKTLRDRELDEIVSEKCDPSGIRKCPRPYEISRGMQDNQRSCGFNEATAAHACPICNDCNEVVPRLARVAKNALLNGDFPRVIAILGLLIDGAQPAKGSSLRQRPARGAEPVVVPVSGPASRSGTSARTSAEVFRKNGQRSRARDSTRSR